jgi:uncharacterized HAD superfamily protein
VKLGIDLDDVTAVCAVPYLRRFAERFGVQLPDEREIGWHLLDRSTVKPADRDRFRIELYDGTFFGELDVYPECPAVLERLVDAGHELYFVTARAEKRRVITETWLREKGLLRYAKGVHLRPRGDFTPPLPGRYDAKRSAMYKWRLACDLGLDAFCEDDETIACTLADGDIRVYLFDRAWNRGLEHPNVVRVADWDELARRVGV